MRSLVGEMAERTRGGVHMSGSRILAPIRLGVPLGLLLITGLVGVSWAQALRDASLQLTPIASGLAEPTAMAFIGVNDILVLQKNDGRVRRVVNGVLQPGEVLDVAVDPSSERGLLGIALHPGFPTVPLVYLYYTESSTGTDVSGAAVGNRVYRYTWDGNRLTS